jgi:hypothetical protein
VSIKAGPEMALPFLSTYFSADIWAKSCLHCYCTGKWGESKSCYIQTVSAKIGLSSWLGKIGTIPSNIAVARDPQDVVLPGILLLTREGQETT